jgi:hypothetical protein
MGLDRQAGHPSGSAISSPDQLRTTPAASYDTPVR